MYRDFDSSMVSIDDMEGDISNMAHDLSDIKIDTNGLHDDLDLSDDSSFDDLLDGTSRSVPGSPVVFKEQAHTAPHGHLFNLKQSGAPVYLTYPSTSDSHNVDNYGRIEYELQTKENAMVVIIPNSRGLSVNNQKLADAYATRTGCVTAILDIYFDDPLGEPQSSSTPSTPADNADETAGSFISKFKSMTVDMAASWKRTYWLQSHSIFGPYENDLKRFQTTSNWVEVQKTIDELLKTHDVQSAVIIGFSFGANAAARVAIEGTNICQKSVVKGVVLVHPIYMPVEATTLVRIPTYLIVGGEDAFYTKVDLETMTKALKDKKDRHSFKYSRIKTKEGTPHGFAIAGDYLPMKIGDLPVKTCQRIVTWVLGRI
ncbi:putative hydrolase MhqD [Cyberlindnera fabianii]|nr:putative hydrolase MhqD [Cyberlindnera fabianii]